MEVIAKNTFKTLGVGKLVHSMLTNSNSDEDPLPYRKRLSEQAYDNIVMKIFDGKIVPGQRLVEAEIAKDLGISTAPVREAIGRLHRDGWIENVANKGSSVIDHRERNRFKELFLTRRNIEVGSFYTLAKIITDEQLAHLRIFIVEMEDALIDVRKMALEKRNETENKSVALSVIARLRQADMNLHVKVVEFACGQRMVEIFQPILMQCWLVNPASWELSGYLDSVDYKLPEDSHRSLYEALVSRDAGKAAKIAFEHISFDTITYHVNL